MEIFAAGRDLEAQSPLRRRVGQLLTVLLPTSMAGVLAWGFLNPDDEPVLGAATSPHQVPVAGETVVNWSATHSSKPRHFYQPETQEDVEAIVADCAAAKRRLRVVGSGLSPNAIGFSDEGMMSMALLDKVLWVNPDTLQVRVEAGCRVQQVADALKPFGMTLQNFASIREQQIGGYTQVSAHGTGATIPPVDEQVVGMKMVTPGGGVMELSEDKDPELFKMARVGLGCLGVITELTLQAVPLQKLRETSFVVPAKDVAKNHAKWLHSNRHLRYMWIPYTEDVVVVQVNPEGPPVQPAVPSKRADTSGAGDHGSAPAGAAISAYGDTLQEDAVDSKTLAHRLEPLRSLLMGAAAVSREDIQDMSAMQLRDSLLVLDPLSKDWVVQVNQAEAEFWKRSAGQRVGYADQILGFDCGGQQWVLEVAFPIGSYNTVTSRWRSRNTFERYAGLVQDKLMPKYAAAWHWAKIEPPASADRLAAMQAALAAQFPLNQFRQYRKQLDPDNILGNHLLDTLLR
eukprot:gene14641-14789_t